MSIADWLKEINEKNREKRRQEGWERGWQEGWERGFREGYELGYSDAMAGKPKRTPTELREYQAS